MKNCLPLLMIVLAGCQTTPTPVVAPSTVPALAPVASTPVPLPPDTGLERRVRQQAQYIEALISQNEALSAQVKATAEPVTYPSPVARALMKPVVAPAGPVEAPAAPKAPDLNVLMPNADGVVDLAAALVTPKADEPVNPFTVRTVPADSIREVSLQVGGIVAGPVTCAVINDRLVQAGDTIESLGVERIESDAVILKHGSQRLRLPVGGKTLRVRLPI